MPKKQAFGTCRWDIVYGESVSERAARLEAAPKLRLDGHLDMRFADMRWLKHYREHGDWFGNPLADFNHA